jgi:hypothetical protein
MICKGLTTAEYLKKSWKGLINPYDNGCCRNFINFFKIDRDRKALNIDILNALKTETEMASMNTTDSRTPSLNVSLV